MSRPVLAELEVGQSIGSLAVGLDRTSLVRYAGASGDLNPIHWNDRFAAEVGLPGVIAHGMLTMGAAVELVTQWAQDPAAVVSYGVRFTRPVPVPDPGLATLEVSGVVGAVDLEAGTARVDLTVTVEGVRVLGRSQATVRL
ncbi:MaoC family dehydratase [Actinotalea sp. K2]|uniref:MaoC family dehydratase n=1 Tax=Actinotalea sp. K2 TaxID=2939438 RepID=UPI002016F880|nr:MaoC family dehydratase [Actinotalea sp. K2]MCL3860065.1 MaoC family dehydratase [Actinotalea sp. K2]